MAKSCLSDYSPTFPEEGPVSVRTIRFPEEIANRPPKSKSHLCFQGRQQAQSPPQQVQTLKELCCRSVGQNVPFDLVQQYRDPVPDFLQKRICYWSFPSREALNTFYEAFLQETHIAKSSRTCQVQDLVQTGMYLSGKIQSPQNHQKIPVTRSAGDDSKRDGATGISIRMCVMVDRGKITSTSCSCESSNGWCRHVIALCEARFEGLVPLNLTLPISEKLQTLDRRQLQKLAQYLIARMPLGDVRIAVDMISDLEDSHSQMSTFPGAPDITAGGCVEEEPSWSLDKKAFHSLMYKTFSPIFPTSYQPTKSYKLDSLLQSLVELKDVSDRVVNYRVASLIACLEHHNDLIAVLLEWALERSSQISESIPDPGQHTSSLKWTLWCLSRMVATILNVFIIDPAFKTVLKKSLLQCIQQPCLLSQDSSMPINNTLHLYTSIHDRMPVVEQLPLLIQALIDNFSFLEGLSCLGNRGSCMKTAGHYICRIGAVLNFLLYHMPGHFDKKATLAQLTQLCNYIFPGLSNPSGCASLQEMSTINYRLSEELDSLGLAFWDFMFLLIDCLPTNDDQQYRFRVIFAVFGQLSSPRFSFGSLNTELFLTWAQRKCIAQVKKVCTDLPKLFEATARFVDLAIEHLCQVDLINTPVEAVGDVTAGTPRDTRFDTKAVSTSAASAYANSGLVCANFNLLILVLHCKTHPQACLELLQTKIFAVLHTLPEPEDRSITFEDGIQSKILLDVCLHLFQTAFTELPEQHALRFFGTLDSAYPWPLHPSAAGGLMTSHTHDQPDHVAGNREVAGFNRKQSSTIGKSGLIFPSTARTPISQSQTQESLLELKKATSCGQSVSLGVATFVSSIAAVPILSSLLAFKLKLLAMRVLNCHSESWLQDVSTDVRSHIKSCQTICQQVESSERLKIIEFLLQSDLWLFCIPPSDSVPLLAVLSSCLTHETSALNRKFGQLLLSLLHLRSEMSADTIALAVKLIARCDPYALVVAVNIALVNIRQSSCGSTIQESFKLNMSLSLGIGYSGIKEIARQDDGECLEITEFEATHSPLTQHSSSNRSRKAGEPFIGQNLKESLPMSLPQHNLSLNVRPESRRSDQYLSAIQECAISILGVSGETFSTQNINFKSLAKPHCSTLEGFQDTDGHPFHFLYDLICDSSEEIVANFRELMKIILHGQLKYKECDVYSRRLDERLDSIR